MLDTHIRKYVQPIILIGAKIAMNFKLSANQITIIAMITGILSSLFTFFNFNLIAVFILWFSGYLDAVDGTIARETKSSSPFGTVMDITFDRIVEGSIIIAIAYKYPEFRFISLLLAVSIILSMTIFLTTASLVNNKTEKTFYYQPGLAERTEGFIMLTLMILLKDKSWLIINIFILMVLITAVQRFIEAKKLLTNEK